MGELCLWDAKGVEMDNIHKTKPHGSPGQAIIEYALILVLVAIAFGIALALTGPTLGNVFYRQVYSLIGADPNSINDLPDQGDFWATVTSVAANPRSEVALPTSTRVPPTSTATPGPSPTASPTVPTNTPIPSQTPLPSPTPIDVHHVAPWSDSADNQILWRLDDQFYIANDDWYVSYYPCSNLNCTADIQGFVGDFNPEDAGKINFDWSGNKPVQSWDNSLKDNWSATFRRRYGLDDKLGTITDMTLRISIPNVDDGVRVWILGGEFGTDPKTCSTAASSGSAINTENNWILHDDAYYAANPSATPDCLIASRWDNGSFSLGGPIERTVKAGQYYTIQVDYYEYTGSANLNVEIGLEANNPNPDDTRIDGGGSPVAGNVLCDWGHVNQPENNPNSKKYMWDSFVDGELASNSRCHLELRGDIEIPASMVAPEFSFWDVWDFRGSGINAYAEISEYVVDGTGKLDRAALNWQKIPMHSGGTANYNWTHHKVDLRNVNGINYIGKKITVRFVLENISLNDVRRWYVDTINVKESTQQELYPAMRWRLDDPNDKKSFITSGWWELTSTQTKTGTGMAFELAPGTTIPDFDGDDPPSQDFSDGNLRMHTVEFNGMINLDNPAGVKDLEGDNGIPLLTFWQAYSLDRYTGLEIQYTADPYTTVNPTWNTVPGTGQLIQRDKNTNPPDITNYEFVTIPLDVIPVRQFRLRFALTVHENRTPLGSTISWFIDEIQLERLGREKFTNLPFHDTAENGEEDAKNWFLTGSWNIVEGGIFNTATVPGHSYHDSPGGDYGPNQDTAMELRWPIDFFLDTPNNPRSPACTLGADCETPDTIMTNPELTLWMIRTLESGENVYIEWKRADEGNNQWKYLWAYQDRMSTYGNTTDSNTRYSYDWERVEVSFKPILDAITAANNPADKKDDDVVIRIRLQTSSSNHSDGLYVDEIRIREAQTTTHALWTKSATAQDYQGNTVLDASGNPMLGDGELYDGLDNNTNLFNNWFMGGGWIPIIYNQKSGLYAFHDSAVSQTVAPLDRNEGPAQGIEATLNRTFNVLEKDTIIDLRGVDAAKRPILYFWSRYIVGRDDKIYVQVSYEDASKITSPDCRNNEPQCYEHRYGWSEWQTVWNVNGTSTSGTGTITWQREQADLSAYAKQAGNAGKRIRIRFVLDAMNSRDNQFDGWYIDDITLQMYNPRVFVIDKALANGSFFDAARNMFNWVPEGTWGLSPDIFRGSGGGPASLGNGIWKYAFWDVNSCPSWNMPNCAGAFLDASPNVATSLHGVWRSTFDINYDWGYGGPNNNNNPYRDRFVGWFELNVTNVGTGTPPGDYTFITISDDGVRMKAENVATPGGPWNIINNWTDHGRTVDIGTASLSAGNTYKIILQYFENSSAAILIVSTGSNSFSFTDSPKAGGGPLFPEVPAVSHANSSLLLNGVFDLSNATEPVLQYYTYYELGGTARVEVTTDGGFNWTDTGLQGSVPGTFWTDAGGNPTSWRGEYYDDTELNYGGRSPDFIRDDGTASILDLYWGSGSPKSGWQTNTFSVRWTRKFTLKKSRTITWSAGTDDGMRLWLDYANGCADRDAFGPSPSIDGGKLISGAPKSYNDKTWPPTLPDTGCLMIADWENGNNWKEVSRTLPPGTYTLQFDMYENTGTAFAYLETRAGDADSPTYNGTYMPTNGDWLSRQHDLTAYAGLPAVGLRFRLDRLGNTDTDRTNQGDPNWLISWWIVDILVVDP